MDASALESPLSNTLGLESPASSRFCSGLERSMENGLEISPLQNQHHWGLAQSIQSGDEKRELHAATGSVKPPIESKPETTATWRKRISLLLLFGAVVVVIIALAIALPLYFTRRRSDSSTQREAFKVPTTGAYNGTGMALLQLGTDEHEYSYHLYYQHATGEIKDLELKNYEWVPASYHDVGLPASVRNGTPMALASYQEPGQHPTYHIFYIDTSGFLQETINENGLGRWHRGSLGNLRVSPSKSKSVGLTACSNEKWNGDNVKSERRFQLYYGGTEGLVHELIYNFGSLSWTSNATFRGTNGESGIACTASNSSLSYVFLSNADNQLEIWWKDSNDTIANAAARTKLHPLNVWSKVPDPAPVKILPNSSIARIRISDSNNLIFFQDPSYHLKALQPVVSAENSSWGSILDVGSAIAGPGSQMAVTTMFQGNFTMLPNLTESENKFNLGFHVLFQTNGSDITEYVRDYTGGQWLSDVIPNL